MTKNRNRPLDYADIRVASDDAVMIAVDFANLSSKSPVYIKKTAERIQIIQDDQVRVDFRLQIEAINNLIDADNEVVVAQVRKSGKIQIFENIIFK